MDANDVIAWIRLAVAGVIFASTCIWFGWLAESIVRRNAWRGWVLGLLVVFSALIWPVAIVAYTIYDARRYLLLHPHDDAPGMVIYSLIYVGVPFLFLVGLLPISIGVVLASRQSVRRVKEAVMPRSRWLSKALVLLATLATGIGITSYLNRTLSSKNVTTEIAPIALGCSPCARTVVFSYDDFGPQSMSWELIGHDWNQWKSEGHPLPDDVEVKVVVYRGVDLSQVKREFPVLQGKSDYRYLEYSKALPYLREQIRQVENSRDEEAHVPRPEPNLVKIWDELLQTLKKTEAQIIGSLGA